MLNWVASSLFRDHRFAGTANLGNVAPGQSFTLYLGIDESLEIKRDLVEREVDKRLFGGNRRITSDLPRRPLPFNQANWAD